MELNIKRRGNVFVVRPRGVIDGLVVHQLEERLMHCVDEGAVTLVLDLSEVRYLTSACLGAFMLAHKRTRKLGGGVRVARPQPLVRQILEITKLTKLFGLYDSVEDAVSAA